MLGESRPSDHVPRETAPNLAWRRRVLEAAEGDEEFQGVLRELCRVDVLFWVNAFVFIVEPRRRQVLPFCTWPVQDRAFDELVRAFGVEDRDVFKSRDMGATWLILCAILHAWLFVPNTLTLIGSRKEELVDGASLKALFPKMDFVLQRLPKWMLPRGFRWDRDRTRMALVNPEIECRITGEATVGDFARGDRTTVTFIDEYGAIKPGRQRQMLEAAQDNTECLILCGTPQHKNDVWAERSRRAPVPQIRMMWWDHPEKARGLYRLPTGEMRSPAYDKALQRANGDMRKMAREWDCDFDSAETLGFDLPMMEARAAEHVRPPLRRGWLDWDRETMEILGWRDDPNGEISLWVDPDRALRMPMDRRYVSGSDIATGVSTTTGARSNSVTCVADRQTGEVVAVLRTAHRVPEDFARASVALAHWFAGADSHDRLFRTCQMNFEANGVGQLFRQEVVKWTGNVWYRDADRREEDVSERKSNKMGWWSDADAKHALLKGLEAMVRSGVLVIRDEVFYAESRQYVLDVRGRLVHSLSKTDDPAVAGENHGDTVIAMGVMAKLFGNAVPVSPRSPEAGDVSSAPGETLYSRRQMWEASQKRGSTLVWETADVRLEQYFGGE